ncbi:MAG: hypothetical protein AAF657_24925 [Acidobacteriota bacterium]
MHYCIRFHTAKFDVRQEDENTINPIPGQSLLLWLKDKLAGTVELDEPDMEDWGWYSGLEWQGRDYLLGATALEAEPPSAVYEWIFQVDKHRTLKEKLFGREKMTADDECLMFFKSIFDAAPEFEGVEVD